MKKAPKYRRYVSTVACGVLLAMGLPPLNLWFLAPIAMFWFCSILTNAQEGTGKAWFLAGLTFGFGYFLAALHWIGFAFFVDVKNDLWMMPFALGGLSLFLAGYWGLACVACHYASRRNIPLLLSLPLGLFVAEWLRGHLLTGFPWASPGMISDGMGGTEQIASLVGLYGMTYCIVLWSVVPWALWQERSRRHRVPWQIILIVLLLPLSWVWGELRLAKHPTEFVADVRLRLVQPNISQSDKWRDDNKIKIFEQLLNMSADSKGARPTHIIWPESSVPFLLDESAVGMARVGDMLGPGRMLMAGAIRREQSSGVMDKYFTSVLAIDGAGRVTGHYDKWRLVPGGEFLPLAWLLEPLGFSKIANLPESFQAGNGPQALAAGPAGSAGILICYEAIFPDAVVDATHRPHWLLNVTNDGWFGHSVGPWQHLAQVRMRAIEQGLPLVRAANTGVSAVIDPAGRIIVASSLGSVDVIDSFLPTTLRATLFSRWNVLPVFLLISVVMILLVQIRTKVVTT